MTDQCLFPKFIGAIQRQTGHENGIGSVDGRRVIRFRNKRISLPQGFGAHKLR